MFKSQSNDTQEQERITIPPQVTPIIEDRDKIPEIRIGLAERIRSLYLRTGDRFHLTDQVGKILFSGKAQAVLWIRQKNFRIEVLNRLGERLFRTTGSVFLSYDNPSATTVLFEVQYLHGTFWAGRDDRIYRGRLQFLPKDSGLTIINRLNMEEYLYGVIPSEMEYIWPTEALEAQAIAARTYAISHKNAFNSRGFDLLPTIASQVYGGVQAERVSTNIAVDATRGRILTYNGKPISAFYTGNSGGYTASSLDLWGDNVPYLQAVPDKLLPIQDQPMGPEELAEWLTTRPQTYSNNPKYSAQSHFRWTAWISRLEIERRLRLGDKLGHINSIEITGRTRTGVVTKVTINGTIGNYTITGDAIRAKLGGLRSNMFILEPKLGKDDLPEYFIFNGGGWGHGVGLDQSGAAGMAADGYQCEEILSHYYPGTDLDQLY
jgi:SpoIID/LytB domain protein